MAVARARFPRACSRPVVRSCIRLPFPIDRASATSLSLHSDPA